jgi:hypothetical protein
MTFDQLFRGDLVLGQAVLQLANRVAFTTAEGMAYMPGPETDAILLLTRLRCELKAEFERKKSLRDKRRIA